MLHQSEVAKRRQEVGTSGMAGHTMTQVVEFDFPDAFTAATDTIEIGMLPARNQLLAVEAFSTLPAANTATLKLMEGEFGSKVDEASRVVAGNAILSGDVNAGPVTATRAACLAVPKQNANTGLGVTLSANVAAGAGKLTLVLTYAA